MNLGTIVDSLVGGAAVAGSLLNATTGVPALVADVLPLLGLFIGIRLIPKLVRKFAR